MRGRQRRGPEGPSVIQLAAVLLQVFPGLPPDLPGERRDSFGVSWNKAKALQRGDGVAVKGDARARPAPRTRFPATGTVAVFDSWSVPSTHLPAPRRQR